MQWMAREMKCHQETQRSRSRLIGTPENRPIVQHRARFQKGAVVLWMPLLLDRFAGAPEQKCCCCVQFGSSPWRPGVCEVNSALAKWMMMVMPEYDYIGGATKTTPSDERKPREPRSDPINKTGIRVRDPNGLL